MAHKLCGLRISNSKLCASHHCLLSALANTPAEDASLLNTYVLSFMPEYSFSVSCLTGGRHCICVGSVLVSHEQCAMVSFCEGMGKKFNKLAPFSCGIAIAVLILQQHRSAALQHQLEVYICIPGPHACSSMIM